LRGCVDQALQVSIMAGVRLGAVLRASGATAAVRCMPNTPALIGQGITGLYASPAVSAAQRAQVEQILGTTGQWVWMREEAQLDAVTALSGSGPAYVFYVLEALISGGVKLGLDEADAKKLALATLSGATSLAAQSSEPPSVLRERVTSKGGTTYAALQVLRERGVSDAIEAALKAAVLRAQALGDELGA
jgi:pyrroline-5-carboxylate reductase